MVAVLTKLSQEHEITVSCMCSDHSKMTSGGSISNHFYGRGVDIATGQVSTVAGSGVQNYAQSPIYQGSLYADMWVCE